LTSKTDRKGQTITYMYDDLNRLTSKTYPDTTSVAYTYDLVSMGFAPPKSVVIEFCRVACNCEVEGDTIIAKHPASRPSRKQGPFFGDSHES